MLNNPSLDAGPDLKPSDMPYVTFSTLAEEDAAETRLQGKVVFVDRHYARITPPGSRDIQIERVDRWWKKLDQLIQTNRMPREWKARWVQHFEQYRKGIEIPVDGTPIRGWKLLSGAQQETLIRANILTVESLATLTAEAKAHIGMGAIEMQRRAQAWIEQTTSAEGASLKISSIEAENKTLRETVQCLTEKMEALSKVVDKRGRKSEE